MILESKNLKPGDLLMINLKKEINTSRDWFNSEYPEIDLVTEPFIYNNYAFSQAYVEVVNLSWKSKDKLIQNNFYITDFVSYAAPTQDNEFVKMMCSNKRMLDI